VSKSLNELEALVVCAHRFTGSATVSELFQRELTQMNPFTALDTCLRAIRVAEGQRSINGVRLSVVLMQLVKLSGSFPWARGNLALTLE